MKILKFIPMMFVGMVLLGFNSCLNSDSEPNTLTKEEVLACYYQVAGYHSGKVIYAAKNPDNVKDQTDTASVTFNVKTDSTMTIYGLPIRALAENMSYGSQRDAMKNVPDINLDCYIGFYNTSPVAWLINPITPEIPLTYDGKTENIKVAFFVNSNYSLGAYGTVNSTTGGTSKKQIQMQVTAGAIYRNNIQTAWLTNYTPFYIVADAN